jgi:hypothetical protein
MVTQAPLKLIKSQPGLSRELQIGKAAEHVACADLMLQGFNAFLSDAGLPYDLLVDVGGAVHRVQVKSTLGIFRRSDRKEQPRYRFGLRRGADSRRPTIGAFDAVAFVALDTRRVAYVRAEDLVRNGQIIGTVEIADEETGKRWGNFTFQKLSLFPLTPPDRTTKACFRCGSVFLSTLEFFPPNKRCRDGIEGICRPCARKDNTESARARRDARRAQ